MIAQRVNSKLAFDPKAKRITNHRVADALLDGVEPRGAWRQNYRL